MVTYVDGEEVSREYLYSTKVCKKDSLYPEGGSSNTNEGAIWPYPNCTSFEYANVNGIKGAQTTGINNLFTAYIPTSPTTTKLSAINITYPSLFFTMPSHWTNGRAATLTAEAINNSIDLTKNWFISNPNANEHELQAIWMTNIKAQMAIFGGTVRTKSLFTVRSPAPYTTSWFKSNCG